MAPQTWIPQGFGAAGVPPALAAATDHILGSVQSQIAAVLAGSPSSPAALGIRPYCVADGITSRDLVQVSIPETRPHHRRQVEYYHTRERKTSRTPKLESQGIGKKLQARFSGSGKALLDQDAALANLVLYRRDLLLEL
jgi:hypothetical protein